MSFEHICFYFRAPVIKLYLMFKCSTLRESTSVFGDLVVYLLYFQITYVTDTIISRNLNITSQCKNCQDFFFQLFTFSAC